MKILPFPEEAKARKLSTDVGRWTAPHETKLIVDLAADTKGGILEIGCNNGLTTRELALAFPDRAVIGVDYLGKDVTMVKDQRYEQPLAEYGKWCKGLPNVTLLNQKSGTLNYEAFTELGFVFIDGDHSYNGVKVDTELALDYFSRNGRTGIIAWHDYNPAHPGWVEVKRYLDTELAPTYDMGWYESTWIVALEVGPWNLSSRSSKTV